jgi:hypothetical protein
LEILSDSRPSLSSLSRVGDDGGERGGWGDIGDDCGREGHIVVVVVERSGRRLGGKGGRGATATTMTMAGEEAVVADVPWHFYGVRCRGVTPTRREGWRAIAIMLRHCVVEVALAGRKRKMRERRTVRWCGGGGT